MPVYKLKIIKKPLQEAIPDIKPNFQKLDNLHLELLENKKKIKPGLPLIPIKKTVVKPVPHSPPKEASPPPKDLPKKHPDNEHSEKEHSDNGPEDDMEDDFLQELGVKEPESPKEFEIPVGSPEPSEPEASETEYVETEPQMSPEEQQEEDRQEYLVRFKILKKRYPKYDFPFYTENTDLMTLKRLYNDTFRMINIDSNVESYRVWLMGGFLGIELLAVKAGLDFKGFAKFQFKKMDKYERMLVELGEKSYSNFAANWPVEVRLLGIILLDAGIFYLGKIVSDYAGEGVAELFGTLFGMPPKSSSSNASKKPKMRGPTTKPDDIRNMNKQD